MKGWREILGASFTSEHAPNSPTSPRTTDRSEYWGKWGNWAETGRQRSPAPHMERPDMDTFAERAAIHEFAGGEDLAAAERAAAAEQGYSNPADLYAATTRYWRRKLEVVAGMLPLDSSLDLCGQARITNALRFV